MYKLEQDLVNAFLKILPSSSFAKNGHILFSTEFDYSRGRTDIIILNHRNELIAIEAKLNNWRNALHQAYRNTCFAKLSYILVPESTAKTASKYLPEFSKRSVGLCFISQDKINIAVEAKYNIPLQDWLHQKAIQSVKNGDKYATRH